MKANEWKLGMSSCAEFSIAEDVFKRYSEAGVDLMEISLKTEDYPLIKWKETEKFSKAYGVGLWSFHLPFWPFKTNNIASLDANVRKNTIEMQAEYIKKGADIGIKHFVIHPSGEPNAENLRGDMLKYAGDSLVKLAEIAGREGAVIAVEDLPRTCIGNTIEDIQFLISGDERLRVCFDTNHLLTQKNADFVKALGKKIITIHASDYDFADEKHWLPYEGQIDWVELIEELEKCGYEGPFMYEIPLAPSATINRRMLTYKDFRENYEAVVNKRPAKAIGVPVK